MRQMTLAGAPEGPETVDLRPYQSEAVASVIRDWRAGHRRCLVLAPTGTGKTTIFAWIASRAKGRVLLLAHRDLLIEQIKDRVERVSGEQVGVEQGQSFSTGERIVVGSIQSMAAEKRMGRFARDAFSCVVVDEAHRVQSSTYRAVLDHFYVCKGGSTYALGVTATPDRLDKRKIIEVFERISYQYEIYRAIEDGWLCPVSLRMVELSVSLDGASVDDDMSDEEMDRELGQAQAIEGVARAVIEMAEARPTLIFTTSVANSRKLSEMLNHLRADCAVSVDGSITGKRRKELMSQFTDGNRQFLTNVDIAGEGWDHPPVSCVVLARPTKSRAKVAQQIGRALRPHPGKDCALIIDVTGNMRHLSLATPLDALAGDSPKEVVALARRMMERDAESTDEVSSEERPAHEYIELARRELERRAKTQVTWESRPLDPFSSLGLTKDDRRHPQEPADRRQIEQVAFLMSAKGGYRRWAKRLTRREAAAIIRSAESRHRAGQCSVAQAVLLGRYGLDTTMSKEQARRAIQEIANNGWRLPGQPKAP